MSNTNIMCLDWKLLGVTSGWISVHRKEGHVLAVYL